MHGIQLGKRELVNRLMMLQPFHLLWLSVACSLIFTQLIVLPMSLFFHGNITHDLVITGIICAFFVSLIICYLLVILIKQVKEREKKYRNIFENTQDVFYQTDANGNFTEISPSILRYSGYSREELIGKPASMFYPDPADREKLLKVLQEKREVADYEVLMKAKDGRLVHVSVNTHFIYNESGAIAGVEGSLRDVTERKQAADAIRLAKEEWERTFDAITDPIMVLDKNFKIVKANKATADKLGISPSAAQGLTCYEVVHGTKEPPAFCPHVQLLADGNAHAQEILEPRLGGFFHISVSPTYAPDGMLSGSIHSARDITELKRAEEVLHKSEKRLRDITASQGDGLYVVDDNGRVTFMNPEAERLLGWTEAELWGKNIHERTHCRKPDGVYQSFEECPLRRAVASGERFMSRDEVFIRKDGRVFPVSLIATPLMEDGKVVGSITSFRDISDRKKLEQEREKLIVELQMALTEIRTLHGVLPICSYCKKIRDDKGAWQQLELYIKKHTDADFTHGLCDDCAKKYYPKYFKDIHKTSE